MASTESVKAPKDLVATYNITKEFLEKVIQSSEGHSVTVNDYQLTMATCKGDNFASVVLSCQVTCTNGNGDGKKHHLIIKTPFENAPSKKFLLQDTPIFRKEVCMYNTIIPTMVDAQRKRGLTPIVPSVPKHYYSYVTSEEGYVVLGDVRPQNYKMVDKKVGLDAQHCQIAIQELARFHANGYFLKDANKDRGIQNLFADYAFAESFYARGEGQNAMMRQYIQTAVKTACDLVSSSGASDDVKRLARSLKELGVGVFDKVADVLDPVEPYATICHGDSWLNNLLFKYDEQGRPDDVILVDLQMVRYSSPATDLTYLLLTSTTKELRCNHQRELLELYHSTLLECLGALGVPMHEFTMDALLEQFKSTLLFGFVTACLLLPLILGNTENLKDETELQTDEEMDEFLSQLDSELEKVGKHQRVIDRLVGVFEDYITVTGESEIH